MLLLGPRGAQFRMSEVPLWCAGRWIQGYLKKEIQTPMAQGRSTESILMIKWIWISNLSMKKSHSAQIVPGLVLTGAEKLSTSLGLP